MTDILKPRDEKDIGEALQWALAEGKTLEVVGHGTKRAIGRAAQTDFTLDLSGLAGVDLYEPEELILSARAGTPLAEIETLLAAHNQELAFEPMDCGPLLGGEPGRGTLAGTLAANLSGPRRIKAGAARDFSLGVQAVSGRGEPFKAGGRVVKNVTGYDLSKLVAGSWGTLAVLTHVTIKVLPRAEDVATVLVLGLDDGKAVEAMSVAMGSSAEVSGAAHLPADAAARIVVVSDSGAGRAVTALRLEGIPVSIAYRKQKLEEVLRPFGALASLAAEESRALWRAVRDVAPFADGTARAVWRISVAPGDGPKVAATLAHETRAEVFYDWAGGLVWAEMPTTIAEEAAVRAAVAGRGHALLVRAAPAARASAHVFEPLDPVMAALSRRVKESFDPRGILNPGRMYAGV
ncbi:MAG: FAD-binding protein [Bradyrhizobiaceae bacterium]|nr:FAD-binding protein [Bradyrhizobiaceae bacterium]